MKRYLAFAVLLFSVSIVKAGQPVSIVPGLPESNYGYTNGTVSVSSYSAALFDAVPGYRQVRLHASTSFFYALDGTTSTATIVSSGFPVLANTTESIESNKAIRLTLPAGISATSLRYEIKQK